MCPQRIMTTHLLKVGLHHHLNYKVSKNQYLATIDCVKYIQLRLIGRGHCVNELKATQCHPSKREMQCWLNAGTPSATWPIIEAATGLPSSVCWDQYKINSGGVWYYSNKDEAPNIMVFNVYRSCQILTLPAYTKHLYNILYNVGNIVQMVYKCFVL